jgi:hypothetical protein
VVILTNTCALHNASIVTYLLSKIQIQSYATQVDRILSTYIVEAIATRPTVLLDSSIGAFVGIITGNGALSQSNNKESIESSGELHDD